MSDNSSTFGCARLPRTILFGSGQRGALGAAAAKIGSKALLVADVRQSAQPEFVAMLEDLAQHGAETHVFDGVEPDLPLPTVEECAKVAASFGPDLIVAVGGGSAMDTAKVAAVLLTHGGHASDYYGEFAVPGPLLPLIALPTTSGTGSEVSPVAVVSDEERGAKVGIASPYLVPEMAICDPELTLTCPPQLTADSGADALTHAVEGFTTITRAATADLSLQHVFVGKNALSDHFARLAIGNIFKFLARAVRDGSDLEAREGVMMAAMAAGCAFGSSGTAAAHALQYPIGNMTKTAHGTGVAAVLPYVMQFNRPNCAEAYAELAELIGLPAQGIEEGSQAFIEAVAELFAEIGIPRTLADLGLPGEKVDAVAEQSLNAARLVKNNPRPLDLAAMRAITGAAYSGDRKQLVTI